MNIKTLIPISWESPKTKFDISYPGALIVYADILNEKQKASNPKKKKDKQRDGKREQEEMIRMRNGSVSSLGKVKELWCITVLNVIA